MTSRLDRLFVLLETGQSAVTRNAAAKQLGEVQKMHPHELHTLLDRISNLLKSTSWDTRVAASQAVAAVLEATPKWKPKPLDEQEIKKEDNIDRSGDVKSRGRLSLYQLDISVILEKSKHLLSCEDDNIFQNNITEENLVDQKQKINQQLGIEMASKLGIDFSNLVTTEDLMSIDQTKQSIMQQNKKSINELIENNDETFDESQLSSRERNRAKRKARRQAVIKQKSRDNILGGENQGTSGGNLSNKLVEQYESKRKKLESIDSFDDHYENTFNTPDMRGEWHPSLIEWPFEKFFENLSKDLFSVCWETRHGAATALRELIRIHGDTGGVIAMSTQTQMDEQHEKWLEDVAARLLCVLALDRFGDFISDAVVAPVRETAAQCLGCIVKIMKQTGVETVLVLLLKLMSRDEWEARHGGLLGIKYLLAVREDLVSLLLPKAFDHILNGLNDSFDDVSAVAAASLIPVTQQLIKLLPGQVECVVNKLWSLLGEQDELAGACNTYMSLLAAMLSLPEIHSLLPPTPLPLVLPRLWPFLTHSTSTVRRATLQTMRTLTQLKSTFCSKIDWSNHINLLQDTLRHIFQHVLIEHVEDIQQIGLDVWKNLLINSKLDELLHAACPFVSQWICLTMQPSKLPFDPVVLIQAKSLKERRNTSSQSSALYNSCDTLHSQHKLFIGGSETIPIEQRELNVMRARLLASKMLGLLSTYIVQPVPGIIYSVDMESPLDSYVKILLVYLQSKSALQRMVVALIISEWAKLDKTDNVIVKKCPDILKQRLHFTLTESFYFDEIAITFTRLLQDTNDFIALLRHYKVSNENLSKITGGVFTLEQITNISNDQMSESIRKAHHVNHKQRQTFEERRKTIYNLALDIQKDQRTLTVSCMSVLASACVHLQVLPEKIAPVVRPLMEALKHESDVILQNLAAWSIASIMDQCVSREPCPNKKIITNLCVMLCGDPEFTPKIQIESSHQNNYLNQNSINLEKSCEQFDGILTLINQQKLVERNANLKRMNSQTGRGPGRPPSVSSLDQKLNENVDEVLTKEEDPLEPLRTQRRGATLAFAAICKYFGDQLPKKLPQLYHLMILNLLQDNLTNSEHERQIEAVNLISSLQVLEVCASSLDQTILPELIDQLLPRLILFLQNNFRAIRHLASRCLAALAQISSVRVMEIVVTQIIGLLECMEKDIYRQGAIEAISCIVDSLRFDIVPYVVLLIIPLLGRMSDPHESVRLISTQTFASLVQLMPLDGAVPEPLELSPMLRRKCESERQFLRQLLMPSTIPDFILPIEINAELRAYQQTGINWLAFLNQYKLHGILCDDMGLGKTLQSICILASDHFLRDKKLKETNSKEFAPLPSLVICPPTLTGHWVYEVEKFLVKSQNILRPLQYCGSPIERDRLKSLINSDGFNLFVASYEIVRKDIEFFGSVRWNYCILDEGHVIKNGKTKASKAIKQIIAKHRLILSGTPIQNNVLELWSLFDFLMPGFLGTEKQFSQRYSRPILNSRDPKSSAKEQEAGVLAMDSLHRQVLPFLLRRMKEDVLDDLPPKITQDYICELSSLQEQLYEDFSKSQAHHNIQESLTNVSTAVLNEKNNGGQLPTHVFQVLRYLQNVCNHPKLVLTQSHPLYNQIMLQLKNNNTTLDNIEHSAKLPALKQLLIDLGIGGGGSDEDVINQHRCLIFCQLKAMLDILENDLFKVHLPNVTYLRLDGSVPANQRQSLVQRFNNDPSIDVLLLTTQVGGLGLNLTGADTVIFVEHDWNPMRDLQAMDRAHRIGQKRVVNVYRLITKHTMEEKIMGLQQFKILTANTVISNENSSLSKMMANQDLLDLFTNQQQPNVAGSNAQQQNFDRSVKLKTVLEELPGLWDQAQYEEEYDLTQFINTLNK